MLPMDKQDQGCLGDLWHLQRTCAVEWTPSPGGSLALVYPADTNQVFFSCAITFPLPKAGRAGPGPIKVSLCFRVCGESR